MPPVPTVGAVGSMASGMPKRGSPNASKKSQALPMMLSSSGRPGRERYFRFGLDGHGGLALFLAGKETQSATVY